MARATTRSRRSCATRWSRSRTGASARIRASIRSASPARSGSASPEGRWRQGGSTITQQLARNILRTNDRSFGRKIREGIVALALEWRFSKDQILELYLNRVYFGGGAYGIDSASRLFYGHSAERLSIAEAAIIAGMVKAPSNYSPTADAEAARGRAGVVIDLMVRNGTITPGPGGRRRTRRELRFAPPTRQVNFTRYFTDWVLPQLDMLIDETVQPIDVWTTLDLNMQRAGVRAINAHAPRQRAGRPGLARPRRRGAGDGRRPRLCQFELQPRHPGDAPARLLVQALRLSDRDRGRLPARTARSSTRRSRSAAGARATARAAMPGRSRSARPSRFRSTPSRCASRRRPAPARSPTWRSASASPRGSTPTRRWRWAPRACA